MQVTRCLHMQSTQVWPLSNFCTNTQHLGTIMGLVLNGVMEFLVKPFFFFFFKWWWGLKTQKFLSNTRRILPHSAMLLVTHKTTLTVSLTQQWKKLGRRTQIYKGSFFHSSLTWDSHGRISFLTTACLEYWEFLCIEQACGFRKLVHFWPVLPCLCCPQPPHSLPNHEYIGCVTMHGTTSRQFPPMTKLR